MDRELLPASLGFAHVRTPWEHRTLVSPLTGLLLIVRRVASHIDCHSQSVSGAAPARPRHLARFGGSALFLCHWDNEGAKVGDTSKADKKQRWDGEPLTRATLDDESDTIYQPAVTKVVAPTPDAMLEQPLEPQRPAGRFAAIMQVIVPRRRRATRGGTESH